MSYIFDKPDAFDLDDFKSRYPDYADVVSVTADEVVINAEDVKLCPYDLLTPAQKTEEDERRNIDAIQNRIIAIIAKKAYGKTTTAEENQLVKRFVERWGLVF